MAEPPPDGLASLTAQRERARRSMPTPRHPLSATPPVTTVPIDETKSSVATPVTAHEQNRPSANLTSATTDLGTPVKVTLYVDRQADEFMENARIEGLTARPKVDISRSAVVRLALRRLMDEMSPAEVKELLTRREVRSTGPGRKRR